MLNGCKTTIAMDKYFGLTMINAEKHINIFMGFDNSINKLRLLTKIIDDLARKGFSAKTIHLNSLEKAYVTLKGESV